MERTPCEDEGKDWSDVSTNQGLLQPPDAKTGIGQTLSQSL